DGVMELREGVCKITSGIDSVVIPETIQDVVMARIDKLDNATRSLLKIASVAGRFFFNKILSVVAGDITDIARRLNHLKEIRLIDERTRLGEVEYLFKHALVQEVTYESILLQKRKQLHLEVAAAVESVFGQRLHDFYGLLALHYSRGENLEKAEEFLVKAGEEALKTAASNEALAHYAEALELYLNKYANAADPGKVAMLEKNIALALYNKGHYAGAVEHFDKSLDYLRLAENSGVVSTKKGSGGSFLKSLFNKTTRVFSLAFNLLMILKFLYLPSGKKKKAPEERDNEIINLAQKRAAALSDVDARRFVTDSIGVLRRLVRLDIAKVKNGPAMFAAGSGLFSYTGISFRISGKILERAKEFIRETDIKGALVYEYVAFIHHFHSGNWDHSFLYDNQLVEGNLKVGELFFTAAFPEQCCFLYIEQGNFDKTAPLIEKISGIGETYDSDLARGRVFILETKCALKKGDLREALAIVEKAIDFTVRAGTSLFVLTAHSLKAYAQIRNRDREGAEKTLARLEELVPDPGKVAPNKISLLLVSRFMFGLGQLEGALESDKAAVEFWRKECLERGKPAVKNVLKYAPDRTEVFRLMGTYYRLMGMAKAAFNWWNRSMQAGLSLGARPELARTYLEVAEFLLDPGNSFKELKGITAGEFREKAGLLYRDMNVDKERRSIDDIELQGDT
ncbi:MAG: hypothetical protein GY757_11450, partial [bacterium]|nr:hypothetical protein [bacterium]